MLLFELYTLLENRINYLKKNLATKIQDKIDNDDTVTTETADEFIDKVSSHDPSKKKTYTQWMVMLYLKDLVKAEDIYKIEDDLKTFEQHKAKLPKTDINQYKSPSELSDAIESLGDLEQHKSKKQKAKDIKHEGADKIYEDDRLAIVKLKTEEAACFYGKGTKWCTAATGGNNMFDYYNKNGPIYVIMDKKSGEKWQWHFASKQYMDVQDEHSNPKQLIDRYPVIRDALDEPINAHLANEPNDTAFMSQQQLGEFITDVSRLEKAIDDGAIDMDGFVSKFPENYQRLKGEVDRWNEMNPKSGFFWTTDQIKENIHSVKDIAELANGTYPPNDSNNLIRSQFAYGVLMKVVDDIEIKPKELVFYLQRGGISIPDIPDSLMRSHKPSDFTTDDFSITEPTAKRYMDRWREMTGRQMSIILRSIHEPKELPKDYLKNAPIHHMANAYSGHELIDATHGAGRKYDVVDAAELLAHYQGNLDAKVSSVLYDILLSVDIGEIITTDFVQSHDVGGIKYILQQYMMAKVMKMMGTHPKKLDNDELLRIKGRIEELTDKYIRTNVQRNIYGREYSTDEIASRPDSVENADELYYRLFNERKRVGSVTDEQLGYLLDEWSGTLIDKHFTVGGISEALNRIEEITKEQWDLIFRKFYSMMDDIEKSMIQTDGYGEEYESDFAWEFEQKIKPKMDEVDPNLAKTLLNKYPELQKAFGTGEESDEDEGDDIDLDLDLIPFG